MNNSKQIQEILKDYFSSKNNLIQHFDRELAYHEFHEMAGEIISKKDKLNYILHTLSRSSTIEMDMCSAKKQGTQYILFFKYAFRLNGNLITGEFEAGDDGVYLGKTYCFADFEPIELPRLDEQQLHNFEKWLFNNNY